MLPSHLHLIFLSLTRPHPTPTLFPYTTLFRSNPKLEIIATEKTKENLTKPDAGVGGVPYIEKQLAAVPGEIEKLKGTPDRKSTRLNSSHPSISYAVFCLKKKKEIHIKEIGVN